MSHPDAKVPIAGFVVAASGYLLSREPPVHVAGGFLYPMKGGGPDQTPGPRSDTEPRLDARPRSDTRRRLEGEQVFDQAARIQ